MVVGIFNRAAEKGRIYQSISRPDRHCRAGAAAFGALGKGEVGYFKILNERGRINGCKINPISLDDGCGRPRTEGLRARVAVKPA
jgi:hypothetical protein